MSSFYIVCVRFVQNFSSYPQHNSIESKNLLEGESVLRFLYKFL
jgi:hypothetical protein